MEKIIIKEELLSKIKEILKDFQVIGPKELPNKGIFYENIKDAEDLYLGESFTIEPIKKFFLKHSECIFREKFEAGSNILEEEALPADKRIVIGVRPCEIRGLTLLDKVFDPSINSGSTLSEVERVDSDYKDEFYINNRKRTIIVGLACNKPDRGCFCTSIGGTPVDSIGMDALLFNNSDAFIIEIITEKANGVFSSLGEELDEDQKKALEIDRQERKNSVTRKIKAPEGLDKIFENNYWDTVSKPCLSCGICTYLCPTCHCFDLVDEERKRLRCYDGCAFADFTLQASGENPRLIKSQRYRQRVFHKFDYFKKNFGENLCVGCGRCIRYCPVKMDIAETVDKVPV